jgi:RimJ/RimL family protein N-acetyltransferase
MGYATEAVRAWLGRMFGAQPGKENVSAWVLEGNGSSVSVLEKCGFVRVEQEQDGGRDGEQGMKVNVRFEYRNPRRGEGAGGVCAT